MPTLPKLPEHGSRSQMQTIVKGSFAQRDVEFRNRVESLEESDAPKDRNHAQVLRQMLHKERRRQMFRKLNLMRHSGGATGVTRIEVPVNPDIDPKLDVCRVEDSQHSVRGSRTFTVQE
jgi:hypothetical protein